MILIEEIAKTVPTRWGDIAQQIDSNFQELNNNNSIFEISLTDQEKQTLNNSGQITKTIEGLSPNYMCLKVNVDGNTIIIPKVAIYNNKTQAAYRVEFVEEDSRTMISAFVNNNVCNIELIFRNDNDVIKLSVGDSEAIKETNKAVLKNIQGHFFCSINFGYGVGTWQSSTGGFIHVITAYGVDVFYDIATDYSITKNDEYIKPNEPLQVKLTNEQIGTPLDDVTAYKVSMCSELCVEGTTGPIMHFRASDSTEDNIYFINSRKDGKKTILTFDVSTKTINDSLV